MNLMVDSQKNDRSAVRWIGTMLLIFVAAFFAWRTAVRNVSWQWDFAIYSAASRAWGAGENPYNEQLLYHNWESRGNAMFKDISWLQSIVPPTTLALIWPFAALPRRASFWTWYSFNCACILTMMLMLIELANLRKRAGPALILAAWVLLLGSVESGIAAGQPAMPAVACIVGAILCASRRRDVAAGLLLGVAAGLKLQLAGPFIVYFALICILGVSPMRHGRDAQDTIGGRWRIVIIACMTFAAIAAIGVGRLESAHVAWFGNWISNIQHAATHGGPNDYITANPNRDHLLNLQVPLFALFHSRPLANILTGLLFVGGAIVYIAQLWRRRRHLLLELAPLAVLTLIPVYHRYYDASLMVIPLALGMMCWRQRWAKLVLVMMLPFLMPVGWAVNLVRYGHVSTHVAAQPWWNIVVMSFWPWMLLAMLIVLLSAGWASPTVSADERDEEAVGNAHPTAER